MTDTITLTLQETLVEQIGVALVHCLEMGMVMPFVVTAMSPNGCAMVVRYTKAKGVDLKATFLAQHAEEEGFVPPVNMMILDQTGEAVRVVIDPSGRVVTDPVH